MEPSISVEISIGELIDKITILQIKDERIRDGVKRRNVQAELQTLLASRTAHIPSSDQLDALTQQLKEVNTELWEIEDEIRKCEARGDFGAEFVKLARSVYKTNDRRADFKRQINVLCGSRLVEEKDYVSYAE